jgi:3-hydroxy-5-methyl-1-naphthoate 3-O-methyltransferase
MEWNLPSTDPSALYRYRDAACVTDALTVAIVELDLLTVIHTEPTTVSVLAGHLGVAQRPLHVIATLLRALGLLEPGPLLRCTALAREHLVRSSPFSLIPYYASLRLRPEVATMLKVVRSGKPAPWGAARHAVPWVDMMKDSTSAHEFTAAMDCRGLYLAPLLAKAVGLTDCRSVLDIAGGSGVYALAMADANPGLIATVLERAPMDEVVRKYVEERGYADRVAVARGDMLVDAFPAGHDVHLLSNVLHDWDEPVVRQLLAKSAEALPSGGRLVIHDAHLNQDECGPIEVAEYSVFLMHATEGRCYSVAELGAWLGNAGMRIIAHRPTAAHRSAIVALKG